jgi:hypothetical protein
MLFPQKVQCQFFDSETNLDEALQPMLKFIAKYGFPESFPEDFPGTIVIKLFLFATYQWAK